MNLCTMYRSSNIKMLAHAMSNPRPESTRSMNQCQSLYITLTAHNASPMNNNNTSTIFLLSLTSQSAQN